MNGFLNCAKTLALLLIIKQSSEQNTVSYKSDITSLAPSSAIPTSTNVNSTRNGSSAHEGTAQENISVSLPTQATHTIQTTRTTLTTRTTQTTQTTKSLLTLWKRECFPLFMLCGGLIIASAVFLILTLVLLGKVCQMSRRLRKLSTNDNLISVVEYNVQMAEKNESDSAAEVKETDMLMAGASPASQEMSNGTTKENGGKVNVGDTPDSEEAPTPESAPEGLVSSEPQEETADAQPITDTAVASAAEGTEEPKDVV